jgi:hypothetical protein
VEDLQAFKFNSESKYYDTPRLRAYVEDLPWQAFNWPTVSEVVGVGVEVGVGVGGGVFVSYVNFWKPFEVKSYFKLAAGMIT